jgi:hypothetical protein
VLLFGVSEQCNGAFEGEVYQVIPALFDRTRDFQEDVTAAKLAERTIAEAKEFWKASPAWTVTLRTHKVADGAQEMRWLHFAPTTRPHRASRTALWTTTLAPKRHSSERHGGQER